MGALKTGASNRKALIAYVDSVLSLKLSHGSTMIMYADDLFLLKPVANQEAERELQSDVDLITEEYCNLFLKLNVEKSQVMVFSLSPTPATLGCALKIGIQDR